MKCIKALPKDKAIKVVAIASVVVAWFLLLLTVLAASLGFNNGFKTFEEAESIIRCGVYSAVAILLLPVITTALCYRFRRE
ncbi:hypothetical protein AB6E89_01335 [Vibrio breoganii]